MIKRGLCVHSGGKICVLSASARILAFIRKAGNTLGGHVTIIKSGTFIVNGGRLFIVRGKTIVRAISFRDTLSNITGACSKGL